MSSSTSLINLGELSKPATVLLEKISEAVGGAFKPFQTVRVARAEAEADLIRAESQIEITGLHQRAFRRFLEEEARNQSTIESITRQALPLVGEISSPEKVEDDWITNFFDKCRIVSDKDMQKLWARVLAGEANTPGTFSRKTINVIADMDRSDAESFTRLCGFCWVIDGELCPLVFDIRAEIYDRNGVAFNSLIDLESLGLIQFDGLAGYCRAEFPKRAIVHYHGRPVELTMPKEADNELDIGQVVLTQAGQQLAPVCGAPPIDGFFEFVCGRWAREAYVPKVTFEQASEPEPAAMSSSKEKPLVS